MAVTAPYRAGASLAPETFAAIRRRMALAHCKWDPQVGDDPTLAAFPLHMPADAWRELTTLAESLAAETRLAEVELAGRPELHRTLGLPRWLHVGLQDRAASDSPRVMRFDFHWTRDAGWRVSEVNADVPGGFAEGSALPTLFASHAPASRPAGDPLGAWVDAIAGVAGGGPVAFVSAPGFMEDHQVVAALAAELRRRHVGVDAIVVGPAQVEWSDQRAFVDGARLGAIVRFCQVEWMRGLAPRTWRQFVDARTPILNDVAVATVESKRLPLVWHALRSTTMPTWRRLLPETRDPRDAPWQRDDGWLLKRAFCNTGDSVAIRACISPQRWRRAARVARWFPRGWIAQRRFDPEPLDTPIGPAFPCVGVFVIDARATGAYVRLSVGPIVDYRAIDVPLLIDEKALR